MGGVLLKTLLLSFFLVACNENRASFTQDAVEPAVEFMLPPAPITVEGIDATGGETRVITDEERDELSIEPDGATAGLSRVFMVNPSYSSEETIDFQNTTVDSTVAMSAEIIGESREFTQVVRPVYSARFAQTGTSGEAVAESFAQNEKGILDILMVIDNSGSMKQAQNNVARGLPSLLNYVASSNWQIAITSTDRRECIRRIITADTSDYGEVFANTIEGLGIQGSSLEEAILMAHRGLRGECQGDTMPWLRENSSVAIIIVTDEDHQCYQELTYGGHRRRPSGVTLCYDKRDDRSKRLADFYQQLNDFYDYLRGLRVPGERAKIYGILNPAIDYKEEGLLLLGSKRFLNWRSGDGKPLFAQTANIFSDSSGYDMILQNISADISVILRDQFVLQHAPSVGTLVVKVTSGGETREVASDEYEVRDNVLTLNFAPPQGSVIAVQYAHNAEPDVEDFMLPKIPLPGSVSVEVDVDGHVTVADPNLYERVGQEIKFHTAPPKGAILTVSYKEDIPLRSELQLGEGRITDLIVSVDGEEVDTFTLDARTNLITFAADALPAEGVQVKALYNAVLEENLSYRLPRHNYLRDDDNLLCFSVDDPQLIVGCEWREIAGKDYIVFSRGEFVPGRMVTVRQLLDVDSNNFQLREHYLPETIKLQVGTEACYASDLVIVNNVIVLDEYLAQSSCPHLVSDQQIMLNYDYIELKQTISIDELFFAAHPHEYEHWEIKIDGERITDFKVVNHAAIFDYRLPPDAIVEVKVSLY